MTSLHISAVPPCTLNMTEQPITRSIPEDLVHNEVMLPVNAPAEYSDPSVLWNSVEMRESKSAKAQLARSYKINLPNEWSYELAIEVMRDYVKRNFVDDGMCGAVCHP